MNISKAIITAASKNQRLLSRQTLVDRDGIEKPVLKIIVSEALRAGIHNICVVIHPGDEEASREIINDDAAQVEFITQNGALGYGHALYCARDFAKDEPFLHMVGDHIYVSQDGASSAQELIDVAKANECAVSGVQPTRETQLQYFGAVGGHRIKGSNNLYTIETVIEKPTPTEAEQKLMAPGLRSGHYLCFFGIHILTPLVFSLLEKEVKSGSNKIGLSPTLNVLARQEKYLAFETKGRRYPLDVRYGLLTAQLALALGGVDRNEVLTQLCELLAQRELDSDMPKNSIVTP